MTTRDEDLQAALALLRDKVDAYKTRIEEYRAQEDDRLKSVKRLIENYVRSSTARPLCLAVFGTPGSGKSYGVKSIIEQLSELDEFKRQDLSFPLTTLNLTQISGPSELAQALSIIAKERTSQSVPVVFFDEFDTARSGAALGWLSWFLAPMNDGQLLNGGTVVRFERVVYIFAGGTASTFQEFAERSKLPDFRLAKGPDFVSRIHGYVNVLGPNDEPGQLLRRASILSGAWKQRRKERRFDISDDTLERLLQVGRFRHGSRSVVAIIERGSIEADRFKLPDSQFLSLHADNGPLDQKALGGPIVVSGFAQDKDSSRELVDMLRNVAQGLWRAGATLAFGGRQSVQQHNLVYNLQQVLEQLPPPLDQTTEERDVRLVVFEGGTDKSDESVDFKPPPPLPQLTKEETDSLGEQAEWATGALWAFSKRLMMTELASARVVFGGARVAGMKSAHGETTPQRFPGIAEEVMLSLALRQPVYVVGTFGGAARDVGTLLGLSRPWIGDTASCLNDDEGAERLEKIRRFAHLFRPPPLNRLPTDLEELRDFFRLHAIGSENWPDNGLSMSENRELFQAKDPERVVELITLGLLNRG